VALYRSQSQRAIAERDVVCCGPLVSFCYITSFVAVHQAGRGPGASGHIADTVIPSSLTQSRSRTPLTVVEVVSQKHSEVAKHILH
jgi:hypothetical protein